MSNSNTNLQTQSSNALHNAIMKAGSKDRPPMLAPVPIAEGSSKTTTERYMENYKNVSQDIHDQLNAEAEAVQIILTGIDNDIYSTIDTCPNVCEMWKAIERLKQGKSINVQDLETNLYWEFGKFTSRDGESLESYYSRFYKMMNELVKNQCHVTNHQVNVQFLLQLQPEWQRSQESTRNRGKSILTSSAHTYDPAPVTVTEDDEISKEKEIGKLMALISLSFKKIYKPTNNNLRTSSNTSRANQDNSLRINRGTGYENQRAVNVTRARENVGTSLVQKSGIQCYICKEYGHLLRECQKPKRANDASYHKEKMLLCKQEEAKVQLNADQADWKDDIDDESDDQELEAQYMYMAQIQDVTPDPVDNCEPIFDAQPLQKVHNNNDNYNVFTIENEHPEQPESVNEIYLEEQGDTNITIDSLDICYDREQDDQEDQRISSFIHGLRNGSLVNNLSYSLLPLIKGLMEKINVYTWIEAREVPLMVDNYPSGKRVTKKREKTSDTQSGEKKKEEKLALEKTSILMVSGRDHMLKKRPASDNGTGEITFPPIPNKGSSDPLVIKMYISGRQVNMAYLESGWDSILPRGAFLEKSRGHSPHNLLLGRTAMKEMGIVVSRVHGAIKFHTPNGVGTIFSEHNSQRLMEEEGNSTNKRPKQISLGKAQRRPSPFVKTLKKAVECERWFSRQQKQTKPSEEMMRLLRVRQYGYTNNGVNITCVPRSLKKDTTTNHQAVPGKNNGPPHHRRSQLIKLCTLKETDRRKADALCKLSINGTLFRLTKGIFTRSHTKPMSVQRKEITDIVKEDEDSWMVPIREYLKEEILPKDPQKARKLP
ncbi:integrase, catalytic region, zinc finger, CCHC-type containing protein [Tanacetum coccineum]